MITPIPYVNDNCAFSRWVDEVDGVGGAVGVGGDFGRLLAEGVGGGEAAEGEVEPARLEVVEVHPTFAFQLLPSELEGLRGGAVHVGHRHPVRVVVGLLRHGVVLADHGADVALHVAHVNIALPFCPFHDICRVTTFSFEHGLSLLPMRVRHDFCQS